MMKMVLHLSQRGFSHMLMQTQIVLLLGSQNLFPIKNKFRGHVIDQAELFNGFFISFQILANIVD